MSRISNQNIDTFKFGDRLQNCRRSQKLTQKELSELLDISEHYLSDIERGLRIPKLDTFVKIVNQLGVSADFILQDSLAVGYKEQAGELQKMMNQLKAEERALVYRYVYLLIASLHQE